MGQSPRSPSRSPSPPFQGYRRSPLQPAAGAAYQGQPGQRVAQPQYQAQQPYYQLPPQREPLEQQLYQNRLQQPSQREARQYYQGPPPPLQQQQQQQYFQAQQQPLNFQGGPQHQPYQAQVGLQQPQYYQEQQQPLNYQGGSPQQQYQYQGQAGSQQQQQYYQGQAQAVHQDRGPHGENYSNPKTAFFHVLFKASAILFYMFGGWITSSFVLQFVIIVLLVAVDFWTVKNVSGRILVGLRYWNESDEQGNSLWRFESLDRQSLERLNKKDTTLFWTSLYVVPAIWTIFGIVAALKFSFDYLMIVIIALIMCASNIIGFTKCRKDAKKKVQTFAQQAMGGFVSEAMTGGITSSLSKVFGGF